MRPRGNAALFADARRALQNLLARCAEYGGRPYLYGWNELTPALVSRFYGADAARAAQLRTGFGLNTLNAQFFAETGTGPDAADPANSDRAHTLGFDAARARAKYESFGIA
jgi:hypothetical protein